MKRIKLNYPWLSISLTILASCSLFIIANPSLTPFLKKPEYIFNVQYQVAALIIILLITLWDIRRFYQQRKKYEKILTDLLIAKKQLQNKAHAYAGHSDKLKLFISERLLEYIQYDEKFLHFKNIASEVRHNGVICFDKVQTALNHANEKKSNSSIDFKDALASMRYLWDLLDLSTTDNIALHIGNYLCECEEHYFQSLLQDDENKREKSPYKVTFLANKVLADCLKPLIELPEKLNNGENIINYNDDQFTIKIDPSIEMLGNENHLRLLFENIINNAQFYHKKTPSNINPIIIDLTNQDNAMLLNVYNHGQQIKNENKEKVFQLGYSTRRKKENHGKGLGLYFVSSIVQGYEGSIKFTNIHNISDTLSISFINDKEESTEAQFSITESGSKPAITAEGMEEPQKNIKWNLSLPLVRIEVFSEKNQHKSTFDISKETKENIFYYSNTLSITEWKIEIKNKRNSTRITFSPIDISGVIFSVRLPTAKARLDYSETEDESEEFTMEDDNIDYEKILLRENQFKS